MSGIRVAVVDHHPLFRSGVVHALSDDGQFEVVAQGQTANDVISIAESLRPDAILMDVDVSQTGIAAAQHISKSAPSVRLIVLTACGDDDVVASYLEAGVRGYLLKVTSAAELIRVVRNVCDGEAYITPTLAARILTQMRAKTRPKTAPHSDLTAREENVLNHLARGLKNKEIAMALSLSEKTVKHYMTSIMQKLQVNSRLEAALLAREMIT